MAVKFIVNVGPLDATLERQFCNFTVANLTEADGLIVVVWNNRNQVIRSAVVIVVRLSCTRGLQVDIADILHSHRVITYSTWLQEDEDLSTCPSAQTRLPALWTWRRKRFLPSDMTFPHVDANISVRNYSWIDCRIGLKYNVNIGVSADSHSHSVINSSIQW